MPWYVYIIQSQQDGTFYKGYTTDYLKRLEEHNAGLSSYTSNKVPWTLKYVEMHRTKTEALKRELMLKRQNKIYLEWLFGQTTNILKLECLPVTCSADLGSVRTGIPPIRGNTNFFNC